MSTPRNGRIEVYPAEILANTDLLTAECFRMADVSCLAQAVLGAGISNATLASGLACTPTSPPSFSVNIAPGTIYSYVEYDALPYPADGSGLPADTTDMLYKQGINLQKTVIPNLNAPVSGTLYYLIEAQLSITDGFSTARQYYNPSAPQTPITLSANSVRQDSVAMQAISSPSGIPTPTSGWVGLWVVTVPSTASNIMSGMIAPYSGSPIITETLTQKISETTADARYMQIANYQSGSYIYGNDSGTANTYVLTLSPALGFLTAGTYVRLLIANTNTGASTLNINGLGATNIILPNGVTLFDSAIIAGMVAEFIYNGTSFILLNPATLSSTYSISASAYFSTSGGFSVAGSAALTPVPLNAVEFDPFSMFLSGTVNSPVTNNVPGAFLIPITGKYTIKAGLVASSGLNTPAANAPLNTDSLLLYSGTGQGTGGTLLKIIGGSVCNVQSPALHGEHTVRLTAGTYVWLTIEHGDSVAYNYGIATGESWTPQQCSYFDIEFIGN